MFDPLNALNTGTGPPSSFIVSYGLACFEGNARVVEGALAIKKATPRGSMYQDVFAKSNMTCKKRGFHSDSYDDDCYPGLKMYYKKSSDAFQMKLAENTAAQKYMMMYNLDPDSISMMYACSCHISSNSHRTRSDDCNSFQMHGSFIEQNPDDNDALLCHGGPYILATRALATLKSSPTLPMHLNDQVLPMSCAERGFNHHFSATDNCFMGIKTWTRRKPDNDGAGDDGLKKVAIAERKLFKQKGFQKFEAQYELSDAVLNGIEGCQCSPKSYVGSKLGQICWQPGSSSPIRDWWRE